VRHGSMAHRRERSPTKQKNDVRFKNGNADLQRIQEKIMQ